MGDPSITAERLRLFAPNCDWLAIAPALDDAAKGHGINTPRRVRHFMAQLHVESGGFQRLSENLNYLHWEALNRAWPRRFPDEASAAPYLRNPSKLAERVYGGRMGNNQLGDGWRFRGRAWIQLTGRTNYGRASAWIGFDLVADPDQAATPRIASVIAAAFWQLEDLNDVADVDDGEKIFATLEAGIRGNEFDDCKAETLKINAGLNGLEDRQRQLLRAAAIWKD